MNLRRPLLVGLLAGTVCLGAVPLAHATFRDDSTASSALSTATLSSATGVSLARSCPLLGLLETFTATWTPSTSVWATDQVVELRDANGVVLAGPRTLAKDATSTSFSLNLLSVGSRTVVVTTRYLSWSATASAMRAC